MSLAIAPTNEHTPASVPYSQFQRERTRRIETEAKLSAVAALLQNPALSHKEARIRASVTLALEAQRPAEDPRRAFRVDTGQLAKRAGLIPPTPPDDSEAWQKAWKSGRKLAGQAIKELNEAGAFEEYDHPKDRDPLGQVLSSEIFVRIEKPHVELIRTANAIEGTRKLQAPRHHNGSRPYCQDCGPEAPVIKRTSSYCVCGRCGQKLTETVTTEKELTPDFQSLEPGSTPAESSGFQSLETLGIESTEIAAPSGFQSLETGQAAEIEPVQDHVFILEYAPAVESGPPLEELLEWPHWVGSAPDKLPIDPKTGEAASTTDPATWGTYDEARLALLTRKLAGLGYVFTAAAGHVGIDLDNCRNPVSGEIEPWALEIARDFNAPAEVSQSGRGLHLYITGTKPGPRCKARMDGHTVEIYAHSRHFIVTGRMLAGFPREIPTRQAELEALYARLFPPAPEPPRQPARPALADDQALIERAIQAKNGADFGRLWRGDLSEYGGDESLADWHLCLRLGYWTGGDSARMDRLYRQSGLYREKWDRPDGVYGTYGARTIARALNHGRA